MTEKRYNTYCDQNENRTVIDDDLNNTHIFIAYCENLNDAIRLKTALNSVTDELNALHEENEQLKQELKTKCIVNKQYEENQRLIKMLDNVANYMQKEHRDMPIDDFVEWWNNIATEGL